MHKYILHDYNVRELVHYLRDSQKISIGHFWLEVRDGLCRSDIEEMIIFKDDCLVRTFGSNS